MSVGSRGLDSNSNTGALKMLGGPLPNVIVFGESGSGKSSVLNMLDGGSEADVSSKATRVTFSSTCWVGHCCAWQERVLKDGLSKMGLVVWRTWLDNIYFPSQTWPEFGGRIVFGYYGGGASEKWSWSNNNKKTSLFEGLGDILHEIYIVTQKSHSREKSWFPIIQVLRAQGVLYF
jgi:hypothetical protein